MLSEQAKRNAIAAQEYGAKISASARHRLAHAMAQGDTWHNDWFVSACEMVCDEQSTAYEQYIIQRYCRDYADD